MVEQRFASLSLVSGTRIRSVLVKIFRKNAASAKVRNKMTEAALH